MAILLQHLCIKLGVSHRTRSRTGLPRSLFKADRDFSLDRSAKSRSPPAIWPRWSARPSPSNCSFGIPLVWGCLITAADVLAVLYLQHKGFRRMEAIVTVLIATIALCFASELFLLQARICRLCLPALSRTKQDPGSIRKCSTSRSASSARPSCRIIFISIPRSCRRANLSGRATGKREAIKFGTIDSTAALMFALLINAAILVLAASAFHWSGHQDVAEIQDAFRLLSPLLGAGAASVLFAMALLASGQNSTLTGTLAGQIVMEGFLNFRIAPWLRRVITRGLAIVPAVVVIGIFGEKETTQLLIASQVVLSMQLGFAVWPLLRFTGEKKKMGEFANGLLDQTPRLDDGAHHHRPERKTAFRFLPARPPGRQHSIARSDCRRESA